MKSNLANPFKSAERASILFIALWSVMFLGSLATIIGSVVRQKMSLVSRLEEKKKLALIADAGMKLMQANLKKNKDVLSVSLRDEWMGGGGAFKDMQVAGGNFSVSTGLVDEERKININNVDMPVLKRLFQYALACDEMRAQELAASVIDWRDEDSELSIPVGSAEDSYYRAERYSYEAKDAAFEVLDELLLVQGIETKDFQQLKDYITIYGTGRVNINTAPAATLIALDLNQETVEKILVYRKGQDQEEATEDDNVFAAVSDIIPAISGAFGLNDSEAAALEAAVDRYLDVNSSAFSANAQVSLKGKSFSAEVACVMNRSGEILYWKQF